MPGTNCIRSFGLRARCWRGVCRSQSTETTPTPRLRDAMALIEDALDALEAAITSSEEAGEMPAPAVTTRIALLYGRIQRLHCTCERLTLGASELSQESDGVGAASDVGALESIRLTSTPSNGSGPSESPPSSQAAATSESASMPGNFGNHRDTLASTPRPSVPSGVSDSDSDGDLVATTYGSVFAPGDLGPMASECSAPDPSQWAMIKRHPKSWSHPRARVPQASSG